MAKNKKIGQGINALISPESTVDMKQNDILISKISPNPNQPRKIFEDKSLQQLAQSIEEKGLITPITVKNEGNKYIIIAGERRFRAHQLLKRKKIPAYILESDSNKDLMYMALIENIQREDLNVIEEANAYKGLIELKNITNENLAKKIGKSSSHVSTILRLLELDDEIKNLVVNGKLSMGHARALIGVPNALERAKEIIDKKLSVRQVENITSKFKNNKKSVKTKDPNITDLEKELSDKIGLKTSIQFNESGSSGSLTLYYSDLNQLDDLMKRLKK